MADYDNQTPDYVPSTNEEQLWAWMEQVASQSERVRREEAGFDDFDHRMDIYYGNHWPSVMPTFRPPIVANELRNLILAEASDLSETQLRVYITKDPRLQGRDEEAERAFRMIWNRNQVDLELLLASVWALIIGTGFIEVGWDIEASKGLGDIIVENRDPRTVLPDPDAINDKPRGRGAWNLRITETVLDLQDIRRLFPVKGYKVKPEDKYSFKDPQASVYGQQSGSYIGPMYGGSSSYKEPIVGYKSARARVLDMIFKTDEEEDDFTEEKNAKGEPERDAEGKPKLKQIRRYKYPNGRRVVGANGVILFDGDNPNPGGDLGLVRVILEPALDRFWSQGFVQQTEQVQLAANKLLSSVIENAIRLNNGYVVAKGNTGLDLESFASIPGQVIQINQGSEFEIKYPPAMPKDMVDAPWKLLDLQRRLLGFEGSRSGSQSKGNVSSELTETEISQSQSGTRLRSRMLYNVVQRVAEMIFARMAYGYTTTRYIPAIEGEEFKPVEWKPLANPDDYAVFVDPASFTVMSRTLLKRLGTVLYKLRAIDRKSLLEAIGWPEGEKIATRMDKAEAMAARMKAQGKGGGKGK